MPSVTAMCELPTDAAESEPELREWMYALLRMLRPMLVVETGTYLGAMAETLGRACRDNANGSYVFTTEPNKSFHAQASRRCVNLPVILFDCPSSECKAVADADLLFLDSDYKYREEEIRRAKKGATIVVHDAYKSYDPSIAPLAPLIEQMGGITFRCGIEGRGFGIMVKK